MRRVSITPIVAGSVVTDFFGFLLSVLWAIALSLALSILCFTAISAVLTALINIIRSSFFGFVVPPVPPGKLMTGDFLTDALAVFWRPGPFWATVMIALVAVLGLGLEARLGQMRYGRLRLALFGTYALAFAALMGPTMFANVQSFVISFLFFPLLLVDRVIPTGSMTTASAMLGADSPVYYGVTLGGSIAIALIGYRILADLIVFVIGLGTSGDFRQMVWRGLRYPPVRSRTTRLLPPASALPRIVWPVLAGLAWGCLIWLAYAGAIYLFVNYESYPPVLWLLRQVVPWLGTTLPGLWIPALACLPTLVVGLIGLPLARLLGRRTGLFTEWIVLSALILGLLWLFQLSSTGLSPAMKDNWLQGFIFGVPIVLVAFAQRRLLWTGAREALARWQAATQKEGRAETYARLNPVLYLRAFMDDKLSMSGRFSAVDLLMGRAQKGLRFEEVVAQRAFNWRPIVALGNPHLPFQLAGALKRRVDDSDWKSEVELWNSHAAYVLMIGNKTENIGWEIELIKSSGAAHRAIYVVTQRHSAADFFAHYELLGESTLAQLPRRTLVVFYDQERGWTAVTSLLRTYAAYALAIDLAIASAEHRHRSEGAAPLAAPLEQGA